MTKKRTITAMEIMIEERALERIQRVKKSITIILDFVERYNKQDKEREVAHAAEFLSTLI